MNSLKTELAISNSKPSYTPPRMKITNFPILTVVKKYFRKTFKIKKKKKKKFAIKKITTSICKNKEKGEEKKKIFILK